MTASEKKHQCETCGQEMTQYEERSIPGIGFMHTDPSVCTTNLRAMGFENAMQYAAATAKRLFSKEPRDPDRIDEVLREIERIWRKHPDLRLTQLIANVLPGPSPHYNVEDNALLERLRKVYP